MYIFLFCFYLRCIYPYILTTSFYASFLSATLINLDRCISMFCPMRYHSLVTNEKLITACVIQFILAVTFALMKFNIPAPESGFYCASLVDIRSSWMNRIIPDVILAGNVVAYFLMTWQFKTHCQREVVVPMSTTRKTLSKLTLVSSFLVLCYTPALITSHAEAYLPDAEFVKKAKNISRFLALINSNLNPVLYVWRFYEIRFQFLTLFCFWNGKKTGQTTGRETTLFCDIWHQHDQWNC